MNDAILEAGTEYRVGYADGEIRFAAEDVTVSLVGGVEGYMQFVMDDGTLIFVKDEELVIETY
jgi:hypothetical protein